MTSQKNIFRDLINRPNSIYKNFFIEKFKKLFEELGIKFNIYRFFNSNGKYGICDKDDLWSFLNSLNTNSSAIDCLYRFYLDFGNKELDFENNTKESIDILFDFFSSNFELLFTENITKEYYRQIELICNYTWSWGQITSIIMLYLQKDIYPDSSLGNFSLKRGEKTDFNGSDFEIITGNDVETFQIKTGKGVIREHSDSVIITDTVTNNFKYKTDYYAYVFMNGDDTKVLIFENIFKDFVKKYNQSPIDTERYIHDLSYNPDPRINVFGGLITIDKSIIKFLKTIKMPIPEKLREILKISSNNKYVFNLCNNEEKTYFKIDKDAEMVIVSISDFNDENLETEIDKFYEELKDFFK